MRSLFLVSAVLLLVAGTAVTQSNQVLDEILGQEQATFGQAAYIAFLAGGRAPEDASVQEVYNGIAWNEWNLKRKAADEPVTVGEFSYMVMENLGIQGGIMYRIAPGPRYAARELDYLDFLLGSGSPYRTLSGRELLHVMGQALAFTEDDA
jgi:hypothetical protein